MGSKKVATNRKKTTTKHPAPGIATLQVAQWTRVAPLPKKCLRVIKKTSPIDLLIAEILTKIEAKDISTIGVSPGTNEMLRKALFAYSKKTRNLFNNRYHEKAVGMTMLQYSPCDVEGAEDMVLYVRNEALEKGTVTIK